MTSLDQCVCDPMWAELIQLPTSGVACSEAEMEQCETYHEYSALCFGALTLLCAWKFFTFWLVPQKFSTNQSVLHGTFFALCGTRFLREMSLRLAIENDWLRLLYYLPYLLSFSAISLLVLTWLQIFKLVTGKGKKRLSRSSPQTWAINVFVYVGTLIALFWGGARFALVPAAVASVFVVGAFFVGPLQKYKNMAQINSSMAHQFGLVTMLSTISALLLLGLVLASAIVLSFGLFNDSVSSYLARESVLGVIQVLLVVIQLTCFWSMTKLTVLPLPNTPEDISAGWLTTILQARGTLDYSTRVKSFDSKNLRGGCHYKVAKLNIVYTDPEIAAPRTVVVKLLCWNKSLLERVSLFIRYKTGFAMDKAAQYLESYTIEALFYKDIAPLVKGLQLPEVFFNHADAFNNKFGMIMQDINLQAMEDGQPNGFSHNDTFLCLQKLARFHAVFWDDPCLDRLRIWKIAGHWTGDKRLTEKQTIKKSWVQFMESFGTVLNFDSNRGLGRLLQSNLDKILHMFETIPNRTLAHGDFKVTNVFIDKSRPKTGDEVFAIDWQWAGGGTGALDIAYLFPTSAQTELLSKKTMKKLVKKAYHSTLLHYGSTRTNSFTFTTLWHQFMVCWVDFFVYCVTSKWCTMTPEVVEKYARKGKDGLHLRSLAHMQAMIDLTAQFVVDLDLS